MKDNLHTAIEKVSRYFGERTFHRGVVYAKQGRVRLLRPDWPVVATVDGTERYAVTAYHAPESDHVHGECSCPVGYDCKHVVATVLIALSDFGLHADARRQDARCRAVGDWLSSLTTQREQPKAKSRANYVVAYVLEPAEEGVRLGIHRTTALRRGGFGKSYEMVAISDPSRGIPGWVPDDDVRRIATLRAASRLEQYDTSVRIDRLDRDIIADVVGTGRLFWQAVGTQPLANGPAREARLGWVNAASRSSDDEGEPSYRLGIDDATLIIAAHDLHYLDIHNGLFGPLDVGVSPQIVQQLLFGPPVPESMLATVLRSVTDVLDSDAVTGLASYEDGGGHQTLIVDDSDTAGVELVPHLRVSMDVSAYGASGGDFDVSAAAVYGDERFTLGSWEAGRTATRDLVREGACERLLNGCLDKMESVVHRASQLDGAMRDIAELRYIVQDIVPRLREDGWVCHIDDDVPTEQVIEPDGWVNKLEPKDENSDWFHVELGVTVAGRTVPLLPILLDAIRSGELPLDVGLLETDDVEGRNIRLPDGELVYISGDRIKRWARPLVELQLRGLDTDDELVVPAFTAVELGQDHNAGAFAHAHLLDQAATRLQALVDLQPVKAPRGFQGTLRDYQRQGVGWLSFLHAAGYGGILADDMGLGKTVQVVAFLCELRTRRELSSEHPVLVIAPRSVLEHWRSEIERFAPSLRPKVHIGTGRAKSHKQLGKHDVVITSYQTMMRDAKWLTKIAWTSVFFDEAQALKNPGAQVRKAAAQLRGKSRFGITGTPIENNLRELWSQIDLVMPGLLGRKVSFEATIRHPIEKFGLAIAMEFLRNRIKPFMLRRTKADVALDLPDKLEFVERVQLDDSQRDLYESMRLSLDDKVRAALKDKGVQGNALTVLDALLKLRQCCCHPQLIKTPQAQKVKESAKLERLMSMLEELADSGRHVLVFSQFTAMLTMIEKACKQAKISTVKLTGQTRNREKAIQSFQAGDASVFLISLKAGGTGLNLTRADTVIHYDPWWNPAVEAQATDRAHRIGQDKKVFVYKLVAQGTLEERIADLQQNKRDLANAALDHGGASNLRADDLHALYRQLV